MFDTPPLPITARDESTLRDVKARAAALELDVLHELQADGSQTFRIVDPNGRVVINSRRPAHMLSALIGYSAARDRYILEARREDEEVSG